MHRVTAVIDFCYGHRLLNYDGPCRFLHGHNGRVEIDLAAEKLDRNGMVVDFGKIKRTVKEWIDREMDHRMLLNRDDPLIPVFQERGEPLFIMEGNPTAEHLARLIYTYVKKLGFPVTEVRMWETTTAFAAYTEPWTES
ncbi:MAG: 6-carboxytetrahydropterin synthase [Deltaproteobacteria bacterium]|nr:6-carboxytetrahydropterin synthase [Deltaproteobacteria bacterium]